MPLRKERGRVFYELSSSSVLQLECRQKTRLGKLTYLAYFLMKLYYSYSSLRSYSYKYALRKRLRVKPDNVESSLTLFNLLNSAKASSRKSLRHSFYANRYSGVYRSSKSYRAYNAFRNNKKRRNYISAKMRNHFDRMPDATYSRRKYKYFYNTLSADKPARAMKVSMLLRNKHSTRTHDDLARSAWSYYRLRRLPARAYRYRLTKKHRNRRNIHKLVAWSKANKTARKKAIKKAKKRRSFFLHVLRRYRYKTLRRRRWFKFTQRFFSIPSNFLRSTLPLKLGSRKFSRRRSRRIYRSSLVATRVLHAFIRSKNVTNVTFAWPRCFVFLFVHSFLKLFFLYKRISHLFSVIFSCMVSFASVSLCFQILNLRCYVSKHCTFLSIFSSLVYSTTLPFLQFIYTSFFFTG